MLHQLLLAFALASVTVIIHTLGAVRVVLPFARLWYRGPLLAEKLRPVATLNRLVSGLLCLHLVEMAIWAAAFTWVGVFADFETSLYYSLKSYTTVGYGDVLPPTSWRLVGPIEAAVGVLMLGLSTGGIVATVSRLYRFEDESNAPSRSSK
jgi:hypothetical protein